MRRIAIPAEGSFGPFSAKTAVGVLRYGSDPVVAVIDSATAGKTADEVLGEAGGVGAGIPVVASVAEALKHDPDTLLLGIAPIGGRLPDAWRPGILLALEKKLLHHAITRLRAEAEAGDGREADRAVRALFALDP